MKRNELIEKLIDSGKLEFLRQEQDQQMAENKRILDARLKWDQVLQKARSYFDPQLHDAIVIHTKYDGFVLVNEPGKFKNIFFEIQVDGCAPVLLQFAEKDTNHFEPVFCSPVILNDVDTGEPGWAYNGYGAFETTRLDLALADAEKKNEMMQKAKKEWVKRQTKKAQIEKSKELSYEPVVSVDHTLTLDQQITEMAKAFQKALELYHR